MYGLLMPRTSSRQMESSLNSDCSSKPSGIEILNIRRLPQVDDSLPYIIYRVRLPLNVSDVFGNADSNGLECSKTNSTGGLPILKPPQRIGPMRLIQQRESRIECSACVLSFISRSKLENALVDKFLYIKFAVIWHVRMD